MDPIAPNADEDEAPGEGARTLAFLLALRAQGVNDRAVLRAMERVPRERFAPARFADLALTDISIPLPCGQTMMPPSLVASFLVALQVKPGQRVLEVGTGSGYVAALLVELGAQVVSVERYRSLAVAAYERLQGLGIRNVDLQQGDGLVPTRLLGRFDAILLNGTVDDPPVGLIGRLAPGGRLVGAVRVDGTPYQFTAVRGEGESVRQLRGASLRLPPLMTGVARAM